MRLIDHFQTDLAACGSDHARESCVRYWRRAVEETLFDRSLTSHQYPHLRSKSQKHTKRWLPYWLAVSDEELHELFSHLRALAMCPF